MSFIFYDFETTGLKIHAEQNPDKIVQFMFMNASNNTYYSSFVNPKRDIDPKAIVLNGITNMDVQPYLTIENYIPSIVEFIGTTNPVYLIAHNGKNFDMPILLQEMQKLNYTIPKNWYFIDSLKIARYILPELPNHKLPTLRRHYNISSQNEHLATKDVFDLHIIFEEFLRNYTIEDLHEISQKTAYVRMPFGKHKGKLLKEIPNDYLTWLSREKIISKNRFQEIHQYFESIPSF